MIIKEKIGTLASIDDRGRTVDRLLLEWFETSKRILHKKTEGGREVVLKFLGRSPNLQQDDVLFADDRILIVVDILECEVITIRPKSAYEMASVCYEIGNKHLPLFFEEETLLIPFDHPVFTMLQASGFNVSREKRKLMHPLKTTVSAHAHTPDRESLFSKILKITASSNE
jgi:urease accessory protein